MTRSHLEARDTLFRELMLGYADHLNELWSTTLRLFVVAGYDFELSSLERAEAIEAWTVERRVTTGWLRGRLECALLLYNEPRDYASSPHECRSEQEERMDPSLAYSNEVLRRQVLRATAGGLAGEKTPPTWRHVIVPEPVTETEEEFIRRARSMYASARRVMLDANVAAPRRRPERERHARWLLDHRINRRAFADIAKTDKQSTSRAAVERAVGRFAADVGLNS